MRKEGVENVALSTQNILDKDKPLIKNLNIGIINIMPKAEEYEANILNSIRLNGYSIQSTWIRLEKHAYKSSDKKNLEENYTIFGKAVDYLDGLIVTGAPVEHLPYQKIHYWEELKDIMLHAYRQKIPTVGICWAGLAVAELFGIKNTVFKQKLFGVFKSRYLGKNFHGKELFYCPHSRFAGVSNEIMLKAKNDKIFELLAYSDNAGYFIFETPDKLFTAHTGHPEYHKQRIADEYYRDVQKGRKDVLKPANFNPKKPVNTWKIHRHNFFDYWLRKLQPHLRKTI